MKIVVYFWGFSGFQVNEGITILQMGRKQYTLFSLLYTLWMQTPLP